MALPRIAVFAVIALFQLENFLVKHLDFSVGGKGGVGGVGVQQMDFGVVSKIKWHKC